MTIRCPPHLRLLTFPGGGHHPNPRHHTSSYDRCPTEPCDTRHAEPVRTAPNRTKPCRTRPTSPQCTRPCLATRHLACDTGPCLNRPRLSCRTKRYRTRHAINHRTIVTPDPLPTCPAAPVQTVRRDQTPIDRSTPAKPNAAGISRTYAPDPPDGANPQTTMPQRAGHTSPAEPDGTLPGREKPNAARHTIYAVTLPRRRRAACWGCAAAARSASSQTAASS